MDWGDGTEMPHEKRCKLYHAIFKPGLGDSTNQLACFYLSLFNQDS